MARLHNADREYVESKESLYSSGDAHVVLRWALRQAPRSPQPGVALRALARGPSGLVLDLMSELIQMVVDDNHQEEVRDVITSVGTKVAAPALQRSVESLLDTANLGGWSNTSALPSYWAILARHACLTRLSSQCWCPSVPASERQGGDFRTNAAPEMQITECEVAGG